MIADETVPAPGRRMRWRALAGFLIVMLLSGAAVSKIGLLQLDDLVDEFQRAGGGGGIDLQDVTPAEAGKPQTIMLLGTDGRLGADAGGGSRSDTIILARLDASKSAITLMSIPRDLKVDIPGLAIPDKINAAFANGGTKLTLKTVKNLLSRPGRPFKINHVVQISFLGFRRLVNYLNCVYIDVDRHYFNDVGGPGGYAVIDVKEGYHRLCGDDALAYVRYRHTDSDLIRGARQQDFIRQLLRRRSVRRRLSIDKRLVLARIAGRFTRTDSALLHKNELVSLLKLGLGVADKPIQQVQFGAGQLADDGSYLTASSEAVDQTLEQFLNPKTVTEATAEKVTPDEDEKDKRAAKKKKHKASPGIPSGLVDVESAGETMAISVKRRLRFPFYYPTLGSSLGRSVDDVPRVYTIQANGRRYQAYRMVVSLGAPGEYYGIQGMTWRSPGTLERPGPPILDGPHDTIERDGRKLNVYYDGKKVRLVSWQTRRGVYYIANTLTRDLTFTRITAIARSLKKLGK